ncbi:hypothetical protein SULPSESMR1_02548 [Pseudosulfitobacter pseudonitzschiae]|uniref:Uncharacterized protein n=1 Tax=Pseudosulfitobacter pseudonitzschiae TaxID=1402135 RepID=A0A221K2Y8_9RHOB|nr:hypothetical protein SULPSESMR1_02548 [Pseudosulfitobacter pseudonitzschiae]
MATGFTTASPISSTLRYVAAQKKKTTTISQQNPEFTRKIAGKHGFSGNAFTPIIGTYAPSGAMSRT